MIRKAVIIVLTLATVGIAIPGTMNYIVPYPQHVVHFSFPLSRSWQPGERSIYVRMQLGKLRIGYARQLDAPASLWRRFVPAYRLFGYASGVTASNASPPVYLRHMSVWAPFWAVALLFAAYPTIAFIRGPLRRWRRRREGLCLKCGYNLTGLTEPRCPECATEFDPSGLPREVGADIEDG